MDDKLVAWTLAAPSAPVVKDPDVRPPTTVAAAPTYRFVALSKLNKNCLSQTSLSIT